jgi:hypothetical protein
VKIFISLLVTLWMFTTCALAHELDSNRATLVLRDRLHLSMTFFVDYPTILHQVLAPQKPVQEFLLMYSAMKPQEFQAHLLQAQRKLQGNVGLTLYGGKAAVLTQWVWPTPQVVQNQLQQRAMQAVVAPNDHVDNVQTEIRVEAKSSNAIDFTSVTLQLPPQFQQVLVVSYQPKQVWLKPRTPSPAISF